MDTITLNNNLRPDTVVVPGNIADRMISDANESQLKIYMYLLRHDGSDMTVSSIADFFNYSEQDVKRALRFWNIEVESSDIAKKAVSSTFDDNQFNKAVQRGNVVTFSGRPTYSKDKLAQFAQIPEVSQLIFVAEQYLARPIKSDDIASILYMYDEMEFSPELIEYLIEYCVGNNKKTFRSIEAVAVEWKEDGISTAADAKKITRTVPKEMKEVLAAFGIDSQHQPIDAEIAYVRRWTERFGFGMDIISEAAQRTILAINKPNFKYANSILKGWYDNNVRTIADIVAVDEAFALRKVNDVAVGKSVTAKTSKKSEKVDASKNTKVHDFMERDYETFMKEFFMN